MAEQLRKSGIDGLGDIPWASHICHFYETKADLLQLLVPYFKAGIENNEFCLWVIAAPLTREECILVLQQQIPGIYEKIEQGQFEILWYDDWYLNGGKFDPQKVIEGWNIKLKQATEKDFDGMRVNGNEAWLHHKEWKDFMEYEKELNRVLAGRKIIVICTYELAKVDATVILDVAHAHECAVTKRRGELIILEVPEVKQLKFKLKKMNEELAQKVAERTEELSNANSELARTTAELRRLSNYLQDIREEERTHIAREIHDELGQLITVMKMDVSWLNSKLSTSDEAIRGKLKDLNTLMDGVVHSVRKIASELRPGILDDLGLAAAIEWHLREFQKRSGIHYLFIETGNDESLPDSVKTGLFRIFQECVTNIARHSKAKQIRVNLKIEKDEVTMKIRDDGVGFDQQDVTGKSSLGILGMKERAAQINGDFKINSHPGSGTDISLQLSLQDES
jgi:signal transduction histidine kinase